MAQHMKMAAVILGHWAVLVAGHGTIVFPPSRFNATIENGGSCVAGGSPFLPHQPCSSPAKPKKPCFPGGQCLWFSQGCTIGCEKCGGSNGDAHCANQGKATLPQHMRTYNVGKSSCGVNPWCAPGSAPVMDPCGLAGGDKNAGKIGNGGVPPDWYKQGFKGSAVQWGAGFSGGKPITQWTAGSVVEVAWAITANHGGGYQYRLCKRGDENSEACFQKMPLKFVNTDKQWIQFGGNFSNRKEILALTVSTGTVPAGSQWRRNPIPACSGGSGGAIKSPCNGFQFTPPGDDPTRPGQKLGGFGSGACDSGIPFRGCNDKEYASHMFGWSIVDKVQVPEGLSGDYVLSFRYESEQTPQVWAGCSDITIATALVHV